MRILLKNATVVNVFTECLEKENVLIDGDKIIGVGDYDDYSADVVEDLSGKYICPGSIDGHIHVESTMLTPCQLAKVSLLHGTTSIVADPHEIANVCGVDGILYMLESSKGLPFKVFVNLPSCVPSTPFDESGACLTAEDLFPLYEEKRVLGLAEMMNYPGVLFGDKDVLKKISDAHAKGKVVDGHAPLLSGRDLDKYIATGIQTDHECSIAEEAIEKLKKGQWIMIREGTAAKNLQGLLPLFEPPYSHRCLLVTDDRHPADLKNEGHIDNIIRRAVTCGKSVITAIKMATIQAAQCFALPYMGAVAPGYKADLLILDDLDAVSVRDVYVDGKRVVSDKKVEDIEEPPVASTLLEKVSSSCHVKDLSAIDFCVTPSEGECRVIRVLAGSLITEEMRCSVDWSKGNGIDVEKDLLKLAVIERHGKSGRIGLGYVHGLGLKKGAIASTVSHDSHNLIVVGASEKDMAMAANRIVAIGGGNVVVKDGKVLAEMPLPIAGLMSNFSANKVAKQNDLVRAAVHELGTPQGVEPFMHMAFVSLPVIPHLKMTPGGLVDVDMFERVPLFVKN